MNAAQVQFPIVGVVPPIRLMSQEYIASLPTYEHALLAQLTNSPAPMTNEQAADSVDMARSQFSAVMTGRNTKNGTRPRHLPGYKRARLFEVTRNVILAQYELAQVGMGVTALDALELENQQLQARLAALEARLAT